MQDADADESKLRITLTSLDSRYSVSSSEIAVPGSTRRSGLSNLVNFMLGNGTSGSDDEADSDTDSDEEHKDDKKKTPQIPFDFIISSVYLRTSLSAYVRTHDISFENVLKVDFLPRSSVPSEEKFEHNEHPDWISSISVIEDDLLITSGYDGALRLMRQSDGKIVQTLPLHGTSPILTLSSSPSSGYILSGGMSQRLILSNVTSSSSTGGPLISSNHVECTGGFHRGSITSTSFVGQSSSSNVTFASGDSSGNLMFWSYDPSDSSSLSSSSTKKQKVFHVRSRMN